LYEWLDAHALEVKPRTLAGYRDLVSRYVTPHIGGMRVQAVRPATLGSLYRDLLAGGGRNGRPLSGRTVNYVHAILRKAFNDAVHSEGLIPSNPAMKAKRPKRVTKPVTEVWTGEQLKTFLALVEHERLFPFYRLAAYTGARRGELLNLRWSDVDWKTPAIRIRGSAGMVGGQRMEGTTKSGHERVVSLDAGTVEVLRAHRRRQMEWQMTAGAAWEGTGHVFANGYGRPIYPDSPSQRMAKVLEAYNNPADPEKRPAKPLPYMRLHDLRHIHATHLLLAGVPVHVVADRLGHADASITLRVYAHVIRRDAADIFVSRVEQIESDGQDDDEGPESGPIPAPC
jgi:integrase